MDNELFTESIKLYVRDTAIKSTISVLEKPPGRKPSQSTVAQSQWFNQLSTNEQHMVQEVIQEGIDMALFGFLAVLDGVRVIEDDGEGEFVLLYKRKGVKERINDPDKEYLHDIYNSLTYSG